MPSGWPTGRSVFISIEGKIAEGETIRLKSEVDPKRSFAINISKVEAPRRMIWENGLPLGLFRGARRFELSPVDGGTEFLMREDYTGPLAGMMFKMIPDMQPSFDKFANALAAAAEQ